MNIQHSSASNLWYTPPHIIQMVRMVLGDIELDPASDEVANEIVQANNIFTEEDDGLLQDWDTEGSIFLNAPGGRLGNKSLSIEFWKKLMVSEFSHAIYMGFSVEHLATSQHKGCKSMLEFPFCIPAKRIRFVSPLGNKSAPSHSNVIVYVPGAIDATRKFKEVFTGLGGVVNTDQILNDNIVKDK